MQLPENILQHLLDLYSKGLYLQAYRIAEPLGPFKEWEGTKALVLAGRLAMNLGARQLGSILHTRAWRKDPLNPEAVSSHVRCLMDSHGPLRAWHFLRTRPPDQSVIFSKSAEWLALHSTTLAHLRDFHRAEEWMQKAIRALGAAGSFSSDRTIREYAKEIWGML